MKRIRPIYGTRDPEALRYLRELQKKRKKFDRIKWYGPEQPEGKKP